MRTKNPRSLFVGLLLASFVSNSYGQCVIEGTVNDTNIGGPAVTDSLTGQRVPAGTIFLVALYYAPVDITDPALFMQTGSTTGFFSRATSTEAPVTCRCPLPHIIFRCASGNRPMGRATSRRWPRRR